MQKSIRAPWLSVLLALISCSGSNGASSSSVNRVGTGGSNAQGSSGTSGGSIGSAGRPGGAATGGAASNTAIISGGAGAGTTPSLGAAGSSVGGAGAGMVGANLAGGPSGNAGSGGGTDNGRGPAPTFTMIYDSIITPNCGGAHCHLKRPTPFGYDFSSKSAASAAWRSDVFPGDAENSPMFQALNFAIMPKDKPPLSIPQLFMVYDWINAGALDN